MILNARASCVFLVVMFGFLTGCDSATDLPSRPPDVPGGTVKAKPSSVAGFAFEIDVDPPYFDGPIYAIKVDASTRFVRQQNDGENVDADLDDVRVGGCALIWFRSTGPEDAVPAQALAAYVLIPATCV